MRSRMLGPYSLIATRRATMASLFMQWFIVVTGATVRLTGSGLGCPSWPTCSDVRVVPALEQHAIIEFANRMTAAPTLIAALVACWLSWRVTGTARSDLRIATTLVVAGVLVQALIGALTVLLHLPPEIVAAHFLVSIMLLAAATFAAVAAGSPTALRVGRSAPQAGLRLLTASATLALLLAVIFVGVLTTASGPHSGATGTGQVVERLNLFELAVTLHARGAYVLLALLVVLTLMRARRQEAARDLAVLVVLVAVQVSLGEIQYRSGLPWGIVLAHVVNAALIWMLAVRIAIDATFVGAPMGERDAATEAHEPERTPEPAPAIT